MVLQVVDFSTILCSAFQAENNVGERGLGALLGEVDRCDDLFSSNSPSFVCARSVEG